MRKRDAFILPKPARLPATSKWTWKDHEYLTPAEMADLRLDGLPTTKRNINSLADREGWRQLGAKYARKRKGRGGGWEYHISCPSEEASRRDFLQRRNSVEVKTHIAECAEPEPALIEPSPDTTSARRARVMDARAAVLREVDRRSAVDGQSRRQAIMSLVADVWRDLQAHAAGRNDQCVLPEEFLQLALIANDRGKGKKGLSRSSIYGWTKAFEADGIKALVPEPTRPEQSLIEIYPWLTPFLRFYAQPSKPTIAHALDLYAKSPDRVGDVPSYDQVRRALKSLTGTPDHLLAFKGREGPLALKARLAYVARSTEGMEPGTIYTADGKTFDAEVQHPMSGKPFRPEITTVLDVVTRKVVGWSVALEENAETVADAIRHSVETCGIPAIFYSDRGKGYRNQRISMTTLSLCARLGISATHSLPYNSQARGVIERAHGTIWNRLSKEYPSYMGKDMDREAAKRVHRDSRKALAIIENRKQVIDPETQAKSHFTYAKLIIGWQQFLDDVAAAVADYNDTRHTGLARIRDPENGRMRHPSPNELWAQFEATGFRTFELDEGEGDDLFRPYVKRRTRRALIELHTNEYFSLDLEPWHGMDVLVGFDIHDAGKVWGARDRHGRRQAGAGPADLRCRVRRQQAALRAGQLSEAGRGEAPRRTAEAQQQQDRGDRSRGAAAAGSTAHGGDARCRARVQSGTRSCRDHYAAGRCQTGPGREPGGCEACEETGACRSVRTGGPLHRPSRGDDAQPAAPAGAALQLSIGKGTLRTERRQGRRPSQSSDLDRLQFFVRPPIKQTGEFYMRPTFVKTQNYRRFMGALEALEARGAEECCLVVVDGLPGLGKTTILSRWAADNACVYLRAKVEWVCPAWALDWR